MFFTAECRDVFEAAGTVASFSNVANELGVVDIKLQQRSFVFLDVFRHRTPSIINVHQEQM